MQNIKNNIIIIILLSLTNCQYFQFNINIDKTPIAEVYDKYLYLEDINPKLYNHKTPEDSLAIIREYIEDWAYNKLLLKQAQQNVDTVEINKIVQQFKNDLLIDTYKDLLIQKYIDTIVPPDTLQAYYQKYKTYFSAKKALIFPTYIIIKKNTPKEKKIKKWFFSNKTEWKDSLIKNTNLIKKMDLNGKWVYLDSFKTKIPNFSSIDKKYILKKSKKIIITDSLNLYLVFIKSFIKPEESLPIDFVKNNLYQLILNKRKQISWSKVENDIKQEAIKQKYFKIIKNKDRK